jgi:lycopene cyclase domain-containing protein
MPEYTVLTVIAVLATIALELFVLRTGIFATAQYWLTMVIVFGFQVLVDGWLTKLSDPIVIYHPDQMLGVRFPWDIPIEDYGFGFAMVTLTILGWRRLLDRAAARAARPAAGGTSVAGASAGDDSRVR